MSAGLFRSLQQKMIRAVSKESVGEAIVSQGISRHGAQKGMQAMIGKNFVRLLATCTSPVLLLNGAKDTLNRKYEKAMIEATDKVQSQVLSGCGHLCNLECSSTFTAEVRRFSQHLA